MRIKHLHLGDIGTFHACKRKFFYEKIARLKNPHISRPKFFDDGTYGHLLLEEFHTQKPNEKKRLEFIKESNPEDGFSSIIKLVDLYKERRVSDLKQFQVLSCEDSIVIPLGKQNLAFTVDLKVVNIDTHKLEIIDHKFYKAGRTIDDSYVFCMNQPWSYPKLLSLIGQEINRFHLNVVYKRTLKFPEPLKSGKLSTAKTQLTNVTEKDYRAALMATGQELTPELLEVLAQLKRQDDASFYRYTTGRNKPREEFAHQELLTGIEEIEARGEDIDNYPLSFGYGCDKCPFFMLCSSKVRGDSESRQNEIKDFEFEEKDENER